MVVTFDFDDTLTTTRLDDDWGIRYMGPNSQMIAKLKQHVKDGDMAYIVTSRRAHQEDRLPEFDEYGRIIRHSVESFLKEQGIHSYIEDIHFTDGRLKSGVLKHLGADMHYDDSMEELGALHDDTLGIHVRDGEIVEQPFRTPHDA